MYRKRQFLYISPPTCIEKCICCTNWHCSATSCIAKRRLLYTSACGPYRLYAPAMHGKAIKFHSCLRSCFLDFKWICITKQGKPSASSYHFYAAVASSAKACASGKRNWPEMRRGSKVSRSDANDCACSSLVFSL